ncbi:uncharacterized protein LOC124918179 [Impatiens glandulifera]|uniref:uncharacterized protein LOC124918179 n=1 Tax=Impatiens glandulifera TaxID=253017 RepID=UPI001FB0F104|nr:uncharacterized protein LOC124918179 [Impatiens glandulifera]
MEDCNSSKYPMEKMLQLKKDVEGSLVDLKEYRRIIGSLRYLTHTRPDISYAVGIISRYMEKPTTLRQQVVKHIFRYVNGMTSYGIKLKRGREVEELVGFTDNDLVGDTNDIKSTRGMGKNEKVQGLALREENNRLKDMSLSMKRLLNENSCHGCKVLTPIEQAQLANIRQHQADIFQFKQKVTWMEHVEIEDIDGFKYFQGLSIELLQNQFDSPCIGSYDSRR